MRIRVNREIEAPKEVLWSYLADFANISRFHPMLKSSEYIEGSVKPAIGETRQCDFKDGNYLKEKIVEWKEGHHYKVEIYDSSMPVKDARAILGVEELSAGRSRAYMQVDLKATNAFLSPFVYLMYRFNGMPAILRGLESLYKKERPVLAV